LGTSLLNSLFIHSGCNVVYILCCVFAGVLKGTKESVAKTRMFTTGVVVRIRKGCGLSTANLAIPHRFTARRGGVFVAHNSLLFKRNDSGLLFIIIYQNATDQKRDGKVNYLCTVFFPSQVVM